MNTSPFVTVIMVCVSLVGREVASAASDNDEALKAVKAANAAFAGALAEGDARAIAELYTEDARLLPPNAQVVQGRKAVERFWKEAIASGVVGIDLITVEVDVFNDTLVEQGRSRIFGKAKSVIDEGKYLVVWKRIDGTWKLHRDCWNSSKPAP
jgi:uncharacterized protein (TIGR02246 family)